MAKGAELDPRTEPGLASALAALGGRAGARGRVVVVGDIADVLAGVAVTELGSREAIDLLRRGKPPDVLVLATLDATWLRTLRAHPVPLVVVTQTLTATEHSAAAAIPGGHVLGGEAALHVGKGSLVACAHERSELAGLVRALGPDAIRIGLAPTPAWLPECLRELDGCAVAGTVHARVLDHSWLAARELDDPRHVLVPVGLPDVALDTPRAAGLSAVVAAHGLERWTGPVFPSPRVIATLSGQLARERRAAAKREQPSDATRAVWDQARRALPLTGAIVGMQAPDPALPHESPTAAFFAQRALLRVAGARARLSAAPPIDAGEPSPDGLERAREVLANAPSLLADHDAKVVLRGLGMQVTRQAIANSPSGAAGFAERIGFPVVLKALSADLRRRSDIGAIELDLGNAAAVRRAYATIVDNVERRAPTAHLDGIVVAELVPAGLDVRAGVIEIAAGMHAVFAQPLGGGTPIEPVTAPAPLGRDRALLLADAALARIPVPALRRGNDPDVGTLAEVLLHLSRLVELFGDRLTWTEINPVRLLEGERRYVILDAKMRQRAHLEGS